MSNSSTLLKKGETGTTMETDLGDGARKCTELDTLCVNTLRCVSAAMPEIAKSGHPGAAIGCSMLMHGLWGYAMTYDSTDPHWWNRDLFILSNGHGCAVLYVILHLTGYGLIMSDLQAFRRLQSKTPGHPERLRTPGVEVTTGPLGQGISQAVGIAIGIEHLRAKYNKHRGDGTMGEGSMGESSMGEKETRDSYELFDNYVYCILGDGCMMEGVTMEACSVAGHLGLGRLIAIYDSNGISIDGDIRVSLSDDMERKFQAMNWNVLRLEDGDTDLASFLILLDSAKKQIHPKPTLIIAKTTIGFGATGENTSRVHGAPLGRENLQGMREKFGFDRDALWEIRDEVAQHYERKTQENNEKIQQWRSMYEEYKSVYPLESSELEHRFMNIAPESLWAGFDVDLTKQLATREYSGKVLTYLASQLPQLVGGSADLRDSNKVDFGEPRFTQTNRLGRYLAFGVREHAMSAICNGLMAYGGFLPFGATFLNFYTYAWGSLRISALSRLPVLYIASHDSIELGEDGPTHQPVEVHAMLRALPGLIHIRPADGREVVGAYKAWLAQALHNKERSSQSTEKCQCTYNCVCKQKEASERCIQGCDGDCSPTPGCTCKQGCDCKRVWQCTQGRAVCGDPIVMALTRGSTPSVEGTDSDKTMLGGYILQDFDDDAATETESATFRVCLGGSGSEMQIAAKAATILRLQHHLNIRLISLPSWDLFSRQSKEYRESVIPVRGKNCVCSYIEAGCTFGFARYFDEDASIGMETFGDSAHAKDLQAHFHFTPQDLVNKILSAIQTRS